MQWWQTIKTLEWQSRGIWNFFWFCGAYFDFVLHLQQLWHQGVGEKQRPHACWWRHWQRHHLESVWVWTSFNESQWVWTSLMSPNESERVWTSLKESEQVWLVWMSLNESDVSERLTWCSGQFVVSSNMTFLLGCLGLCGFTAAKSWCLFKSLHILLQWTWEQNENWEKKNLMQVFFSPFCLWRIFSIHVCWSTRLWRKVLPTPPELLLTCWEE